MATREIARDDWAVFFDELSEVEESEPVTVEAVDATIGSQIVAREMPLVGITTLLKGSDAGSIEVIVGDSPDRHISHLIASPSHVRVQETEDGDPETVEIEAEGKPTTLLHFRAAYAPDTVDGTEQMEGS